MSDKKEEMKNYSWLRDPRLLGFLLFWALCASYLAIYPDIIRKQSCPYKWHGGSPLSLLKGSCWCGWDKYCLCTPSLAIDAIIEVLGEGEPEENLKIVLVNRRDPPRNMYAIPGGFVDVGETIEAATIREVKEETNLDLDTLEQFRVYSDPNRDKRRHTVSSVFRCRAKSFSHLRKGDDAKAVEMIPIRDLLDRELAFDHRQILTDYMKHFHPLLMEKMIHT